MSAKLSPSFPAPLLAGGTAGGAGHAQAAAPAMTGPSGAARDQHLALTPSPVRHLPLTGVRRVTRRPQTRQRLGRLRQELSKIRPAPSCPEEARDEILRALERAGLGDWSVPELSDATVSGCSDGSLNVPLLSHVIVLNPSGAFRIVDVHAGEHLYFEMPARDGSMFIMPREGVQPR